MKKTILLLQGPTQSGKTSTMKMVLHGVHLLEPDLVFRGKSWVECLEILKLKDIKIGISSRSDKFANLAQNLEFLATEHGCDIIICSANEMMKGVKEMLLQYENQDWEIIRVQKYPVYFSRENKENQSRLNQMAAQKLVDKLHLILPNQSKA